MPQRNTGFLQHRPDANRELLLAVVATPQEPFVPLARLGVPHLVNVRGLAARALGRALPKPLLEKLNCRLFVGASHRHLLNDFGLFRPFDVFVNLHATTLSYTQRDVNHLFASIFEVF